MRLGNCLVEGLRQETLSALSDNINVVAMSTAKERNHLAQARNERVDLAESLPSLLSALNLTIGEKEAAEGGGAHLVYLTVEGNEESLGWVEWDRPGCASAMQRHTRGREAVT